MKIFKWLFSLALISSFFSCSSDGDSSASSGSATFEYDGRNIPVASSEAKRSGNYIAVALYGNDGTSIDFKFSAFGTLYSAWTFSIQDASIPNRESFVFDQSQSFAFQLVELNDNDKTVKVNFSGKVYIDENDPNSDSVNVKGSFRLKYEEVDTLLKDLGTYAKVDNKDWRGLSLNVSHHNWETTALVLDSDNKYHMALVVPYQAAVAGSYTFNGASTVNKVEFQKYDIGTNTLIDYTTSGSFNITEVTSEYVKGTFSFTATNPNDNSVINVTNGTFKETLN